MLPTGSWSLDSGARITGAVEELRKLHPHRKFDLLPYEYSNQGSRQKTFLTRVLAVER